MNSGFEYLEHTSDVLVRAYGANLEEAFEQAAIALMNTLIQNLKCVSPILKRCFNIVGNSLEELLYKYLEEFLFIFDTERVVFSEFEVKIWKHESTFEAEIKAYGEKFNSLKHRPGIEVKAVTYHMMDITQREGLTEVLVLFDI
ncbi:MAG: archease [Thermoproteota archaeon]